MRNMFSVPCCPVPIRNDGTLSFVTTERFRSYTRLIDHDTSRRCTSGMLSCISSVLFCSVPAFCHWNEYPVEDDSGTGRICPSMFVREYVTVSPYRLRTSTSAPTSSSRLISGFRLRLPSTLSVRMPAPVRLNVSYCAVKFGELPAVPYEVRSLNSETAGRNHHGSRATRHATDPRPNVAQR